MLPADPDVIVAAWCGAGDRVPLEKIIPKRGWEQTKAARNGRVYCINDEFLNTPASTLMQGFTCAGSGDLTERYLHEPNRVADGSNHSRSGGSR